MSGDTVENVVLQVVDRMGDPTMDELVDRTGIERDDLRRVVKHLCHHGVLRQKEDSVSHDWTYRRCRRATDD